MAKDIKTVFSTNLRNRLAAKRSSQKELAKFVDVSETSVSHWINGTILPRPNTVDKIALFLGCSSDELMTDQSKTGTVAPEDIIADAIIERPILMSLFLVASKVSDEKIEECIEVLKK